MLARASEVTSVLMRGCVLSIGTVNHTGLGYCLLDSAPRYPPPSPPPNTPSLGKQCVWSASLTDRGGGVVGEAGSGA